MNLQEIVQNVKNGDGLSRKKGIGDLFRYFQGVSDFGYTFVGLGEDAAVIREDNSFLLLAADGIWKNFLLLDPYAAGRASVIVNVNDIVATGGRPIAMVNVISSSTDYDLEAMLEGIRNACDLYQVPMVGGHFHPACDSPELSVAILGRAKKLLTSDSAKPGQEIIVAIDLEGERGSRFVNSWDATLHTSTEHIWEKLSVIIRIAEQGLSNTAKDISNPGILGSIATLLYSSHKGAEISLEHIPRPNSMTLADWLAIYPSYGFVLCVEKGNRDQCLALFDRAGIGAQVVGAVKDEPLMTLSYEGTKEELFDFDTENLY